MSLRKIDADRRRWGNFFGYRFTGDFGIRSHQNFVENTGEKFLGAEAVVPPEAHCIDSSLERD